MEYHKHSSRDSQREAARRKMHEELDYDKLLNQSPLQKKLSSLAAAMIMAAMILVIAAFSIWVFAKAVEAVLSLL